MDAGDNVPGGVGLTIVVDEVKTGQAIDCHWRVSSVTRIQPPSDRRCNGTRILLAFAARRGVDREG